ncbi:MAG: hypothetical protein IJ740_12970 [Ruminococcus sp.]|nr:hypothetical protein [Ruminococcus sp.]
MANRHKGGNRYNLTSSERSYIARNLNDIERKRQAYSNRSFSEMLLTICAFVLLYFAIKNGWLKEVLNFIGELENKMFG